MTKRAVSEAEYNAHAAEVETTKQALSEAEDALELARDHADLCAWRDARPSRLWPEADLRAVEARQDFWAVQHIVNETRDRLEKLRFDHDRLKVVDEPEDEDTPAEIPEVEDAAPAIEPPMLTPTTPRPAADRRMDEMREHLRRPKVETKREQGVRGERCKVDSCVRIAQANGYCVPHRQTDKPKAQKRQRMPDGTCSYGCGRKPRTKGKSGCRVCATHRRMIPTCTKDPCGKPSTGIGGFCSYHDRHLRGAEIQSAA